MMAAGVALFVLGLVLEEILQPSKYFADWKDHVVAAPKCVGALLITISVITLCWRNFP